MGRDQSKWIVSVSTDLHYIAVVYCCAVTRLKGHKAPVTACRFVAERDLLITRYTTLLFSCTTIADSVLVFSHTQFMSGAI